MKFRWLAHIYIQKTPSSFSILSHSLYTKMSRLGKSLLIGAGIVGIGYGLMKLTVPSEQQFIERLPPNLQKDAIKARDEVHKKKQAMVDYIKQSTESEKPVWLQAKKDASDMVNRGKVEASELVNKEASEMVNKGKKEIENLKKA